MSWAGGAIGFGSTKLRAHVRREEVVGGRAEGEVLCKVRLLRGTHEGLVVLELLRRQDIAEVDGSSVVAIAVAIIARDVLILTHVSPMRWLQVSVGFASRSGGYGEEEAAAAVEIVV